MKFRASFTSLSVSPFLLIALSGCGGSSSEPPAPSAVGIAALKGNWLVAGSVQDDELGVSNPAQPTFSLTMTLDVVNGQVIAQSTYSYPCGMSTVGGAGSMSAATIAADGSFTLQSLPLSGVTPAVVLSVHGTVPQTAGASWTGTYMATNSNQGCLPVTGSFTATPIQPITGTFAGMVGLGAPNSALVTAPVISVALQQGGPASLDAPLGISPVNSVGALSGTITVSGFPCFTSGTASVPDGWVSGSFFEARFTMNDGSTLLLSGDIGDTSSSSIILNSLAVSGGGCNGWFGPGPATLTRQ
jgi:hypothetical protein